MQAQLTVVTVLKEIVGYLQRGREDLRYNGLMVHSKPATRDAHYPLLNPKFAQTNNNAPIITKWCLEYHSGNGPWLLFMWRAGLVRDSCLLSVRLV